jgi:dUTP pyrophosphatase
VSVPTEPIDHLPIDIVRLDPELPLPSSAHAGDAGLDLCARESVVIAAGGHRALVPTGIAIAIPAGHCGLIMPRSGLALKHGISIVNAPGLVDAAYRGEIKVVLLNTDPAEDYEIHRGDRIAQLVIQRIEHVVWNVVDELDGVDRGGGFGHTDWMRISLSGGPPLSSGLPAASIAGRVVSIPSITLPK